MINKISPLLAMYAMAGASTPYGMEHVKKRPYLVPKTKARPVTCTQCINKFKSKERHPKCKKCGHTGIRQESGNF